MPPSSSGVAKYASDFLGVLESVVDEVVLVADCGPAWRSQQVRRVLSTAARGVWASRGSRTLVWVELCGRGLSEFYTVFFAVLAQRRVIVTVHDAPRITGSPFIFAPLDHRGVRRLPLMLARLDGGRLERWVLTRCERVVVLSSLGARVTESQWALKDVRAIRHVAVVTNEGYEPKARPRVFCPGVVSGLGAVLPVMNAVSVSRVPVDVVVGSCPRALATEIELIWSACGDVRAATLTFTGDLTESDLHTEYLKADLVVRLGYSDQPAVDNFAATGGPVVAAIAAGRAVVTDDHRGSAEYASQAGQILVKGSNSAIGILVDLLLDPKRRNGQARSATEFARRELSPSMVAASVRAILAGE